MKMLILKKKLGKNALKGHDLLKPIFDFKTLFIQ